MKLPSPLAALLLLSAVAQAEVNCAPVFQEHAVLQQGMPIPIWGQAPAGSDVQVIFADQTLTTKADAEGNWRISLKEMKADVLEDLAKAPHGRDLIVVASKDGQRKAIRIADILIGEVWLCSGQSNMAGKVKNNVMDPEDDLSKLTLPAIRQYRADTGWIPATEGEVREFSKVGLTFARKLQQELKVPVGLLSASVGGTQIHTWQLPDALADPTEKHAPGSNYTKHVAPLVGTAMKGALWYQGEGNTKDGYAYFDQLKTLIEGWREEWGQGDFPFHVVQLAGIGESDPSDPEMGDGRAAIREAQFQAMKQIPNVGLATAVEIGGPKEHPPNKTDIGKRLAHWALHHDYDRNITASGPIFAGFDIRCSTIAIQFDNAQGLTIADKKEGFGPPIVCPPGTDLPWLSIQDAEGIWHPATAWIEGDELLVVNTDVKKPRNVRYAFTNRPVGPYLYNKAGLPAFPFTTEKWEELTAEKTEP